MPLPSLGYTWLCPSEFFFYSYQLFLSVRAQKGAPLGQFQELTVDPLLQNLLWTPRSYLLLEWKQDLDMFQLCVSQIVLFWGSPFLNSFSHPVVSFSFLLHRNGDHASFVAVITYIWGGWGITLSPSFLINILIHLSFYSFFMWGFWKIQNLCFHYLCLLFSHDLIETKHQQRKEIRVVWSKIIIVDGHTNIVWFRMILKNCWIYSISY